LLGVQVIISSHFLCVLITFYLKYAYIFCFPAVLV